MEAQGKYKLSEKVKSIFVDIAINKNDQPHFMIEVKTNLGYQRGSVQQNSEEKSIVEMRRDRIAEAFNVDVSKIIYVLLSDGNVGKEFRNRYWNEDKSSANDIKSKARMETPFNFIFPLFHDADPRYYKYGDQADEMKETKHSSDDKIMDYAEANIVTPLEHIVKLILSDADKKPSC